MSDTLSEKERLQPVANLMMLAARPLLWHDPREPWPKKLAGASCFILRFEGGLVGVTANHVIEALEAAQATTDRIVCLLRTAVLNLPTVLIDRNSDLDIATFRVTEQQLAESEAEALDCRHEWPPPTPRPQDGLSVGGYPEVFKVAGPPEAYSFNTYLHLTVVEDVTDREIIALYDPARGDQRLLASPDFPETGGNLSGCSGGPVLLHLERAGLQRWFPAALVQAGPGAASEGGFEGFDLFRYRRIHSIGTDGMIREP